MELTNARVDLYIGTVSTRVGDVEWSMYGYLDDLVILDRALSTEEILELGEMYD